MKRPDEPMTEKQAVAALMRLSKRWPKTLWLFSGAGTLYVMRCNEQGQHALMPYLGGGVDRDYIVTTVPISNDGGDW